MKNHVFLRWATLSALVAMAAGMLAPGSLWAGSLGGSLVGTTDYVFRGLSLTSHDAAFQGDLHLRSSKGWYAGVWGSVASTQPVYSSDSELNLYAGRGWTLAPEWVASLHYVRYLYLDESNYVRYFYRNYNEVQASLSFQGRATVSVAYTPEILRYSFASRRVSEGKQWSWEASLRQPLWRNLSFTAGVGHYDLSDLFKESYWAWSGGLELSLRQVQFSLTRFGVDDTAQRMFGEQTANGRWALTAAWRF